MKLGIILTAIVSQIMLVMVAADTHQLIYEHQIYENLHQDARSYAYYKLTVGSRYYVTGKEHLTIKVMADSYESDPDVFISKTQMYPTSSTNSDWYCEKEGSETCIIQNGQYKVGDVLFIGISCVRECDYKLRAWFTSTVDLTESHRSQMRFDAYSTQILKYYIPFETELGGTTTSVEIIVQPEDTYVNIDAHLSLDANFYLIEEKPASHIVANGLAIKFTQKDYEWCRQCYVYVIVNIYEEMRYYVTSIARYENDPLNEALDTEIMVNPFQQECFEYFVLRTKEDVKFTISGYTGHADAYVQARDVPTSPKSSKITMRGAHGPSKAIILKTYDRTNAGYVTGTYNLCFYAYSPFSAIISTSEIDFLGLYDFLDSQIFTQSVAANSYVQGRYTNSELRQKGKLKIHMDVQGTFKLPKIYYKVCPTQALNNCILNDTEVYGAGMTEIVDMDVDQSLLTHLSAEIAHDPALCENVVYCYYQFAISNKDNNNIKVFSMRIELEFFDPGNVDLDKRYKNVVQHGQYIRSEISPKTNPNMQYLKSLSIKLVSLQGDADLFVSFSNPNPNAVIHDLISRRTSTIDQVVIANNGGVNRFERTIFFTVFGSERTQYEVSFEYEFQAIYNEKLESAIQIGDGQYIYQNLKNEYQEGFYSFKPWWSATEQRSVIILADMIFNKVFFYSQWNDFPKHFLTTKHDQNDTITYYSGEKDYNSYDGSYYIRLRPDYALYDLISDREYMYNMYTWSQPPVNGSELIRNGYQTLDLGENVLGYANNSDYQDYRHFMVDMKGVFDITLTRLPGQGKPVFYVKMLDSDNKGSAGRQNAYHFKSENNTLKPMFVQNLTIDYDMRRSRWSKCGSLLHSLQEDGKHLCFIAISVRCGTVEDCAYNLKIEQRGVNSSKIQPSRPVENFIPVPPGPILSQEYVNGHVEFNTTKYYQFPVSKADYGNSLIILNKTQIFGSSVNGDSRMLVNLQNDTSKDFDGANYTKWIYPTDRRAGAITATKNNTWPEIIEPCEEIMVQLCKNATGCSFIIGVVGGTENVRSSYRIRGFRGQNKLHMNKPIVQTVVSNRVGDAAYDYYWFVINDTVADYHAKFQYQVSVGSETGNDPDLFVSVMDGRYPVAGDYDFASIMRGADSVQIRSNDTFWKLNGWNTSAGVVVVVGVRQEQAGNYTLVLTSQMTPLRTLPIKRISIGQSVRISLNQTTGVRNSSHLYQLYNWGHKNISISLDVTQGSAVMMYNQAGQNALNTNIFTGVPYNSNNSLQYREITTVYNETNSKINIQGDKCFNCWYFIRINIVDPQATTYQLIISENSDSGGPALINAGNLQQIYILANLSQKRKFLLDSMDNFVIEARCVSGDVRMYIGLDPLTVGPNNYLWGVQSTGGIATISVKTTDAKFHMATFYYVTLMANVKQDTLLNLNLQQQRSVEFIPNNHDSTYSLTHAEFNEQLLYEKYQYQSKQEFVKFHVFQVPGAKTVGTKLTDVFYKTKISINALTPHFYPMVYLKKIELTKQPTELSQLSFPTIKDYFMAFGEDPFTQLYSSKFDYNFYNVSSQLFTYYTMAIYSNNWGLTEHRKSEYQIKVEADIVDISQVINNAKTVQSLNIVQASEPFVLRTKVQEDGSIWNWIDLEAQQAEKRAIEAARLAQEAVQEAEEAAIAVAEEMARQAEEAAREAEEAMMKVIFDSADKGDEVVIIAEEEAADEVVFDEDGNIQDPAKEQENETEPEGETEEPAGEQDGETEPEPEGENEAPSNDESVEPEEQTFEPEDETIEPEDETIEPEDETVEPENETEAPTTDETVEPEDETVEPEDETIEPEDETIEPEDETVDPENETEAPTTDETVEPEDETVEPEGDTEPQTTDESIEPQDDANTSDETVQPTEDQSQEDSAEPVIEDEQSLFKLFSTWQIPSINNIFGYKQ